MTPEEREESLWERGHVLRPDGHVHNPEVVRAIKMAEDEALERAAEVADSEASESPIVEPLVDAAYDRCARAIATAIRALKE